MPPFDDEVEELLDRCSAAEVPSRDRGQLLEELVSRVFAAVPGVDVRARNAKSVFANEELDLVMGNRGLDAGLPSVGPFFSVECKNWSRPVGSAELSWFATKLRRSGQAFGVLVAAEGVTGAAAELTAARFEAAAALAEGQHIVVVTLPELRWLRTGEELAQLLSEKHAHLIARREIHIAEERPRPTPTMLGRRQLVSRSDRERVLTGLLAESAPDAMSHAQMLLEAIAALRAAVGHFLASEESEPSGTDDEPFEEWSNVNMAAFEAVEARLRALGHASIAFLRRDELSSWSVDHLALGLDLRAPQNLDAPPDSALAQLLIDYWLDVTVSGPTYEATGAALCLLAWSIDSLVLLEGGRWPPPWV